MKTIAFLLPTLCVVSALDAFGQVSVSDFDSSSALHAHQQVWDDR